MPDGDRAMAVSGNAIPVLFADFNSCACSLLDREFPDNDIPCGQRIIVSKGDWALAPGQRIRLDDGEELRAFGTVVRVFQRTVDIEVDADSYEDYGACDPACDFCSYYEFNGNEHGAYTGDGRCEHPEHPRPMDPGDYCADYECDICGGAVTSS